MYMRVCVCVCVCARARVRKYIRPDLVLLVHRHGEWVRILGRTHGTEEVGAVAFMETPLTHTHTHTHTHKHNVS